MSAAEQSRTLAILGYHKIGPAPDDWETWFYIPQATFLGHLTWLGDNGWQVIDLGAFLRGLAEPDSLPERAALLTFDDGCRSILQYGLPELDQFGYPAVLFMPTDFIGGYNQFDDGGEPEEALCGWDDLRELERRRVSIQSHSASHRGFSDLDPDALEEELIRSRTVLEAGLGKAVEVFAYPFGDGGSDPEGVRQAMRRSGYRAACLYGGGPQRLPLGDCYRCERVAMGPDTDLQAELRGSE
jgi:peptidoglycan/xylan/chitin deacetylase (PgdA/CDA1 family)